MFSIKPKLHCLKTKLIPGGVWGALPPKLIPGGVLGALPPKLIPGGLWGALPPKLIPPNHLCPPKFHSDFERLKVRDVNYNGVNLPLHDAFLWEKSLFCGPSAITKVPVPPLSELSSQEKHSINVLLKQTTEEIYKKINWTETTTIYDTYHQKEWSTHQSVIPYNDETYANSYFTTNLKTKEGHMVCSYGMLPADCGMSVKVVYLIECDQSYIPTGNLYAEITKYDQPVSDPISGQRSCADPIKSKPVITHQFCTPLLQLGNKNYTGHREWSLDLCRLVGIPLRGPVHQEKEIMTRCVGGTIVYQTISYYNKEQKLIKIQCKGSSHGKVETDFEINERCHVKVDVSQIDDRDYKLVGYKAAQLPQTNERCIVKLGILRDALVTLEHGEGKSRCNKARVLAIGELTTIDGAVRYHFDCLCAKSLYDPNFQYIVGHVAEVGYFDHDLSVTCSGWIHFFLDDISALTYQRSLDLDTPPVNREEMKKIECLNTIEYNIMLRSAIHLVEYRYIMKKAKTHFLSMFGMLATLATLTSKKV